VIRNRHYGCVIVKIFLWQRWELFANPSRVSNLHTESRLYHSLCVCVFFVFIIWIVESGCIIFRRTWCRPMCRLTPKTWGRLLILHRSRCMIREPKLSRLVGMQTTSWSEIEAAFETALSARWIYDLGFPSCAIFSCGRSCRILNYVERKVVLWCGIPCLCDIPM